MLKKQNVIKIIAFYLLEQIHCSNVPCLPEAVTFLISSGIFSNELFPWNELTVFRAWLYEADWFILFSFPYGTQNKRNQSGQPVQPASHNKAFKVGHEDDPWGWVSMRK